MTFGDVQIGATFEDNRIAYRRVSQTRAVRVDNGTQVTFHATDVVFPESLIQRIADGVDGETFNYLFQDDSEFEARYRNPKDTAVGREAYSTLRRAATNLGVPVKIYARSKEGELGFTNPRGVNLVDNTNQTALAATLAHELAHWVAHASQPRGERTRPGPLAEIQAESASYIVLDALGLSKPDSFTYMAAYGEGAGATVLESRDVIERTAKTILAATV